MHEQDAPGQVRMARLVRRQLQRVQEGNGTPGWQVYGRTDCPCQVLSNPGALFWNQSHMSQCLFLGLPGSDRLGSPDPLSTSMPFPGTIQRQGGCNCDITMTLTAAMQFGVGWCGILVT